MHLHPVPKIILLPWYIHCFLFFFCTDDMKIYGWKNVSGKAKFPVWRTKSYDINSITHDPFLSEFLSHLSLPSTPIHRKLPYRFVFVANLYIFSPLIFVHVKRSVQRLLRIYPSTPLARCIEILSCGCVSACKCSCAPSASTILTALT